MGNQYHAEAGERSAKATQVYDTGKEITVDLHAGFIVVRVDGERVFHASVRDLEQNPEDRVGDDFDDSHAASSEQLDTLSNDSDE